MRKILIRREYTEAEEFALSACGAAQPYHVGCRSAWYKFIPFLLNHPGILGSFIRVHLLLYILLRHVALELPTVLQVKSGSALLFYQGGVKEFARLSNGFIYAY